MKDSFVRVHLSPKNDKKFTNESIRQSPLKVTGQRSLGDLIKRRQYAGLIQCPFSLLRSDGKRDLSDNFI